MGDPYFQQRLFGAYMSNAVPNWRNSLRRRGGSRRRLDLGIISLRNLLAHACRVGNEPTAFLLSLALLLTLRLAEDLEHRGACPAPRRSWILFGLSLGLIGVTDYAVISIVPFL